jgi:hypothetical protein
MKTLLTVKEFAEASGLSVACVRKRIDVGTLPVIRIGKSVRLDPDVLKEVTDPKRRIIRAEAWQIVTQVGNIPTDTASSYSRFQKAHSLLTMAIAHAESGKMAGAMKEDIVAWRGSAQYCLDAISTLEQLGLTDMTCI